MPDRWMSRMRGMTRPVCRRIWLRWSVHWMARRIWPGSMTSNLRLHPPCPSGWAAAGPFLRDDRAAGEDLAAPDSVGLLSFDRASQADPAHRAGLAVSLGEL